MKTKRERILLRADGSKKIGIGHLVRSLTLATALKESGREVLVVGRGVRNAQLLDASFSDLQVVEIIFPNLSAETEFIGSKQPDLVIVDGYEFTADFFSFLHEQRIPFGVIDDNFETRAEKPLFLLNQNPIATRDLYPKDWDETTFLLGLEFALIRQAIIETSREPRLSQRNDVLVAIGGTDSLGVTPQLAESLHRSGLSVAIPENQLTALAKSVNQPGLGHHLTHVFSPSDYPTYLAAAKFSVLGGGSSVYEALALDVPTIAVVVADNQISSAQLLSDRGLLAGLVDMRKNSSRAISEFEHIVKRLMSEDLGKRASGLDLSTGKLRAVKEILGLIPKTR